MQRENPRPQDVRVICRRAVYIALLLLAGVLMTAHGIAQLTEVPAYPDQIVDSVGINVHLGYTNTQYYSKFSLIESSLADLGVRHVRDSEPLAPPPNFYGNHSALLSSGIHGEFSVQISDSPADIAGLPGLFAPGYFEAYEPPNECDVSGLCGALWTSNLVSFLPTLSLNSSGYPVLGPSFASPLGPPLIGDVSAFTSIGNIHNYKGGWNPEFAGSWGYGYVNYLSDALGIYLAGITNPGQPVMSTENGYTNAIAAQPKQKGYPLGTYLPYDANSIPEADAAIYMPRIVLSGWMNGIERTYIYELLSSPGEDYGLMRGDGSRKPAFDALMQLIRFLKDPGAPYSVRPLTYTIGGQVSALQHLLVQRRTGQYGLILWLDSPVYDKFANVETPVPPVNVQIATACPMLTATSEVVGSDGSMTQTTLTPGVLNVNVGPNITMLAFKLIPGCPGS